jgi:hypothetical protein
VRWYKRYARGSFTKDVVKVMLVIIIVPIVLFVNPRAFLPSDYIPNWWHQPLYLVVLERQMAIVLVAIVAVLIVVLYRFYQEVG